jgi:predicted nucleic acid-binding protein
MKKYLFDAFPILCWLQEEPGHSMVEDLLTKAEEDRILLSMSMMNLGEVFYRVGQVAGLKKAENIIQKIRFLPLKIISVSDPLVNEAARIKGKYAVSYANAFAVATALRLGATIVTGDPEYKALSKWVKILWLQSPGSK